MRRANSSHRVQYLVHIRHNVMAIDHDTGLPRRTQRHVQHGALFGDIDLLTTEHRIPPFSDPRSAASCSSSRTVSSVMRFFE